MQTLSLTSSLYPTQLGEIHHPPPTLYIKGDATILQQPQIAIVGSRHPTPQGLETAKQFAFELAQAGFVITSGLALGIDAAAHQGALAASGLTIAVLANGLDRIYPTQHSALATAIVQQGGALITEQPCGTPPLRRYFPQRNRIITGLANAVLVIEATLKSGSLISARLALEQNREVLAVPGPIHSQQAQGCNWLIQQGASLVSCTKDVLNALNITLSSPAPFAHTHNEYLPRLDSDLMRLLECVDFSPTAIETIQQRSGLKTPALGTMLLSLELRGYINKVTAGYLRMDKPGIHQTVETAKTNVF